MVVVNNTTAGKLNSNDRKEPLSYTTGISDWAKKASHCGSGRKGSWPFCAP